MNKKSPPPPPIRSRTPMILAGLGAAIALIVVLAVVLTRGGDDGDEASSTTSGSAEVVDPLNPTVTVTGTALVPFADGVADPAVGQPAPALAGTDYAGEPVEVNPGEDGPTLVVFLAHWCPHCNREIPVLNEWRDSGNVPADLRIVGVSTAVAADRPNYPPGTWLQNMDWQWDVIADGPGSATAAPPAAAAYGVTGFPTFVLLDADGNVAARGSGEKPIEYLEELVASVTG